MSALLPLPGLPPIIPLVPGVGGGTPHGKNGAAKATVSAAAHAFGLSPQTLWGVYGTESGFGSNTGPSSAGAVGPFQFLPSTAKSLGINPNDFHSAAFGAAKYLHKLGANSDPSSAATVRALNSYNGNGGGTSMTSYAQSVITNGKTYSDGGGGLGGIIDSLPIVGGVSSTVHAVSSVGDFLSLLTQPSTWFRVGKVAIGSVVVIIGAGTIVFVIANKAASSPTGKAVKSAAEMAALA